jgi:Xaa-Pro aminopeptidase
MRPGFAKRRKSLKKLMEKRGLDAVITPDANDVFYYTGYSGMRDDRIFMLFPAGGVPKLLVSPLENDAAEKYPRIAYIREAKDFTAQLKRFKTMGYDERSLNLLLFREMKINLKTRLVPVGKMMEIPRIAKDDYEIGQLRGAIDLTGKVLGKIGSSLYGKTEKQVADSIEIEYRKLGVSESFESIVCAGRHSAFVHHKPDQTVAKANGAVLVDTGCRVNGYCSDITRMFFRRLDAKQKRIYGDVRQIHDELIDSIRAGVAYKKIEELYKKLYAKNGYRVTHGFGHGIGLSVHESAGDVLKENAVLTVEPGVYIKNSAGFRVEDMVLVKKNRAEVLSKTIPIL